MISGGRGDLQTDFFFFSPHLAHLINSFPDSRLKVWSSLGTVYTLAGKEDRLHLDRQDLRACATVPGPDTEFQRSRKINPLPIGLTVSRDDGKACDWGGQNSPSLASNTG